MAGGRSQRHKAEVQGVTSFGSSKPAQLTVPTVAGTNTVGQTLTGTDGTFSGSPTPTLTRHWSRDGKAIAGANAATYVLVAADSGKQIRFVNTASNAYGHQAQSSSLPRTIA
jgi:hypothetical protein